MQETNLSVLTSFRVVNEQDPRELEAMRASVGPERVTEYFSELPKGSIVVPRYRALPFGDLLEQEVKLHGSELINTYRQHRNIADSSTWAHLLDGSDGLQPLSARQYGLDDIPHLPEGEWFVKGETNSLKQDWLQGSFAPTTKDLTRVTQFFMQHSYVGHQDVVIKPFQKYRKLAVALNQQPIFHERRVFVLDGQVVSEGFYWSSWEDEVGEFPYDRSAYESALQDAIARVGHLARFMVIDMAEYDDGRWGVVELNDGAMSGLSCNDPRELWRNLAEKVS